MAVKLARSLLKRPLIAFNFLLPASAHIVAPLKVPRWFSRILSLGTNFIPIQPQHVMIGLDQSVRQFEMLLRWSSVSGFHPRTQTFERFKVLAQREPPELSDTTAKYFLHIKHALQAARNQFEKQHLLKASYFMTQIRRLIDYCNTNGIIILPADKNLGLTAMTMQTYVDMCLRHIRSTSKLVTATPQAVFDELQSNMLLLLAKHSTTVSADVYTYLQHGVQNAKAFIPSLYCLPKLHKTPIGPRPIVAAFKGPQAHLSTWLSAMLFPVCQRLPAFMQDSGHLIGLLSKLRFDPATDVIVTFDVVSMYPNLRLHPALSAIKAALKLVYKRPPTWQKLALGITTLLFKDTFFVFNSNVYRQVDGIAMGTNAAPNIANIYLLPQEQLICQAPDVKFYRRFIDDGCAVVSSLAAAERLMETLRASGLEFTYSVSRTDAIFLDLELRVDHLTHMTGLLSLSTHRKALNRYLYLPAFSAHHPSNIRAWVYAEILRLRNTCTCQQTFVNQARFFIKQLLRRSYHAKRIKESINMLPKALLSPYARTPKAPTLLPLVDNSGQVIASKPPRIFRAPYVPTLPIPYGQILRADLDPVVKHLDLGAGVANPNPTAPPNDAKTRPTLTLATTHAASMAAIIRKLSSNFRETVDLDL